ncbi:hypothetical protein MM300_10560 [Evansella sp. LMS18]|jgi:CXXC-20-CXXC protein|uniref:TIGR04104 family putative zinc finger protein n=1 Tax=Evansella sp. LMS18 TaxID=2924033 RepID=UPI0020D009ED|nr:TIGR04104 family putative zinc finger protein [Evansella sp. LMS18]UTR12676.1 hypothetical protein MM300_10560 [Evansella sp. LMS18]
MKLPQCSCCGHSYTYAEAIKYLLKKDCPQCGKKQFLTTRSNLRTALPAVIIIFLPGFLIRIFLDLPFLQYLSVTVGLLILTILALPFFFEFTDKKQPII